VKKTRYVLDSYAVLAFFQGEAGGRDVQSILQASKDDKTRVMMSLINLGEVFYTVARRRGDAAAAELLNDVLTLPIHLEETPLDRVLAAAEIKARHAISYADAFVAALASEKKATVVTGDPEFRRVEAMVDVHWI
jgi:ribonuclease VapC